MLEVPSGALNGRYETPVFTQDVALALTRKVTHLQRQIVLELQTPSPDRKPSELAAEHRDRLAKEEGDPKTSEPEQGRAAADEPKAHDRLDIVV